MTKLQVVSFKNLPARFPIVGTCVAWLMLDRLHAPGWLWGAIGAGVILIWTAVIIACIREVRVEIGGLLEACAIRNAEREKRP